MAAEAGVVNVSVLIDRRVSPYQFWVFAVCFLIAFMDGLDTQAIGVTGPLMVGELHLAPRALGPIFSASQWGSLVGAFLFGPCADRWGRRRFLIATCLLFSAATLITAWSISFSSLLVYRFLTGLGIGGAGPCFVALASEYAPRRLRAGMVTIIWGAVPGGGILAGLLGAYLLGDFGWRSIYYASGAFSLLVCVVMIVALPESISFMVARGADPRRIRRVLARIVPGAVSAAATRFVLTEETRPGVPVKHLFTEGRAFVTILLWIGFFVGFMVLIATLVWTPGLLKGAGMSVAQAALALTFNNIGGIIGTIGVGQLIDRFGSYRLLAAIYFGASLSTALLGFAAPDFLSVGVLCFFCGLLEGGGGSGLIALAAIVYPTFMRSTGVGWALGCCRIGSSVGPLLVGILVARGFGASGVFLVLGAIGLIDVVVVLILGAHARERRVSAAPA